MTDKMLDRIKFVAKMKGCEPKCRNCGWWVNGTAPICCTNFKINKTFQIDTWVCQYFK